MTSQPPTDRQRQVYDLYAAGLTKEQIAAQLGVSVGTVHNHLARHAAKHRRRRRGRRRQ